MLAGAPCSTVKRLPPSCMNSMRRPLTSSAVSSCGERWNTRNPACVQSNMKVPTTLATIASIAQLVSLFFLLELSLEVVAAVNAETCTEFSVAQTSCYPWGAEGPAAGRWSYESKGNYLLANGICLVCFAGTLILMMLSKWRGFRFFWSSIMLSVVGIGFVIVL